jgi:tetratricopeptide (TPR) repeat protein
MLRAALLGPVLTRALLILFVVCALHAQTTQAPSAHNSRAGVPTKPKLSPEQKEALQILHSQEGVAKGLTPTMRTSALFEIGRGYEAIRNGKALLVFHDSFQSSEAIQEDDSNGEIKHALQNRIVQRSVRLDPGEGERLLSQVSGPPHKEIVIQLVKKYTKEKQFARAIGTLTELGDQELPYTLVRELMQALPAGMAAHRQDLFAQALSSYTEHEHTGTEGIGDFDAFVSQTWHDVPPSLVLQAIDEILKQARESDTNMSITVGAHKGAASFGSTFEYTLFEVLPILRELDSDRADQLLQEHRNLQTVLDHFPQGLGTPDSFTMRPSETGDSSVQDRYQHELQHRANQIVAEAKDNPKQALAAVMSLPDVDDARLRALLDLAGVLYKTAPSQAREALTEALKLIPSVKEEFMRGQLLADISARYVKLGDFAAARDAIDRGFKVAEKLYESDTDAADPNQVFKAAWPSTAMWSKFSSLLTRISSTDVFQAIGNIPDPEIQCVERIAFANALLRISPDVQMVVVKTKDKDNYMMIPE